MKILAPVGAVWGCSRQDIQIPSSSHQDQIDYLSEGVMAWKISVQGVDFGVERLLVMGFPETDALSIMAGDRA